MDPFRAHLLNVPNAASLLFPGRHFLCGSNKVTGVSDHRVYEQDSRAVPGQV